MHALTRIYFKGGGGGSSVCLILNFSIISWSFFHMSVKTMKQCIYLSIGYRTLEMILSYLSNTILSIKNWSFIERENVWLVYREPHHFEEFISFLSYYILVGKCKDAIFFIGDKTIERCVLCRLGVAMLCICKKPIYWHFMCRLSVTRSQHYA